MLPWHPDITYEELLAHEEKEYGKKFPEGIDAFIDDMKLLEFNDASFDALTESLEAELAASMSGQEIELGELAQ